MFLYIKKNFPDSKLPTRANPSDVGLDVYAHSMKIVGEQFGNGLWKRIDYIEYDCGISIQPNAEFTSNREHRKFFTYLAPRSSISKTNLVQANGFGIIDAGYTGPLLIRYKYIPQPSDFVFLDGISWPSFALQIDESRIYKIGEKIGQIIVTEQVDVDDLEAKCFIDTDRGSKGFGSSGTGHTGPS